MRLPEDDPDAPTYVRDRTPLRRGQITTLALREEFRRNPALPILSGDDIFIRGIRLGVERSDYVYRRGDLLCGPGDPSVSIMIDEQAVVLTMAYARNRGIWPRPEPPDPGADDYGREAKQRGGEGSHVRDPHKDRTRIPEASHRRMPVPRRLPPRGCSGTRWCNSGSRLARDAWRRYDCCRSACLRQAMRSGSSGPSARCPAPPGRSRSREATRPPTEGALSLQFAGPVEDAQPIREFLEPQLRAAATQDLEVAFALNFESGLSMHGDAAEKLTDRLSRFASGAAYVSASAREQT